MFDFDSWGDKVAYVGAAVLMFMLYSYGGWGFLKNPVLLGGFIFLVLGVLGYIFQSFFPNGINPSNSEDGKQLEKPVNERKEWINLLKKNNSEKQNNETIGGLSPEVKGVLLVFIPVILVYIFMTLSFPSY